MAHSNELTSWLLENADLLDLRATELTWARDWGLKSYHDFQISIAVDGKRFIGRGTAASEELAFLKAGAEAIERAYCGGLGIHSVGVAAHVDEKSAQENAINEWIERDTFICHFYTKTPFLPVMDLRPQVFEGFSGVVAKLDSFGITLRLFRAESARYPVVLAVASGLNASPAWGGIVGLGSNSNERASTQSALLEALRNVAAIVLGDPGQTITNDEFLSLQNPTSTDRQRLARNADYWSIMAHLFPGVAARPTSHSRA